MRRIQLYLDDDTDDALSAKAASRGLSRSALVRDAVRSALSSELAMLGDPMDELVGAVDVELEPDHDPEAVIYTTDT